MARYVSRALMAAMPLALILAAAPAGALTNGDFETNSFNGWNVVTQGDGAWSTYSGASSPISGLSISTPPQGQYAATTDGLAPGTHILYRDLVLDSALSHTLAFTLYYDNQAGAFHTPNSLSHSGAPNQQYLVDVIKPSAPVTTMNPSDILASLFRTQVGDPTWKAPTAMEFDLTPLAGQTVRLRFAEVDNQYFFLASVDNIRVLNQADTRLQARPAIANLLPDAHLYLGFDAQLTSGGLPVEGETIDFFVDDELICSATTDVNGNAECGGTSEALQAVQAGSYEAVFAGTDALREASATGRLLLVGGIPI